MSMLFSVSVCRKGKLNARIGTAWRSRNLNLVYAVVGKGINPLLTRVAIANVYSILHFAKSPSQGFNGIFPCCGLSG
jgi:hypothetical protein